MNQQDVSRELLSRMEEAGIDTNLTLDILTKYNRGDYDSFRPIEVEEIPEIDGKQIIDVRSDILWSGNADTVDGNLHDAGSHLTTDDVGERKGPSIVLNREELAEIGLSLYPRVSYGILNGGSATSYGDVKKNSSYHEKLFRGNRDLFESLADKVGDNPKGITPGFIQSDGRPGPSFIELKMRSLLIGALEYRKYRGERPAAGGKDEPEPLFPMFQMTSVKNDSIIRQTYDAYRGSPWLKPLIDKAGHDITRVLTGIQPLIAAFTHSSEGRPKKIFSEAYGKPGNILPLPGGHGQNFMVLQDVYRKLLDMGKKFVYLTNVDNLGSTVDPVEIGLLAVSGGEAGFNFSFKTPLDVKGGILVRDAHYGLTAGDIGPAISADEVERLEKEGKEILFNCGTGLFRLDYLVAHLDRIINGLPVRFTDQNKDAGLYSQAEQVTWEVEGMIEQLRGFAVDKYERFLASKLLLENFLTSGIGMKDIDEPELLSVAENLHRGLERKLKKNYGLQRQQGNWYPMDPESFL